MCVRTSVPTPACAASVAADGVPVMPRLSPSASIAASVSQHMQTSMSAPRASSTTLSTGSVSPVNTIEPSSLSIR